MTLSDVKYIPTIQKNLISSKKLDDEGFRTSFGDGHCKISKGAMVVAKGPKVDTLYYLHVDVNPQHNLRVTELPIIEMWHSWLGHISEHISMKGMEQLSHLGYLPSLIFSNLRQCEHCIYGRQLMSSHKKVLGQKEARLELEQTDVCEMPELSLGGAKYFVSFIDDATRRCGCIL